MKSLKLLVLDCYTASQRATFTKFNMKTGGTLYSDMLKSVYPGKVEIDRLSIVEEDAPKDVTKYDGIAWSGSSYSVYAEDKAVKKQINFAKQCFQQRVPAFGSCWGMQIAVTSCGGLVSTNQKGREFGFGRNTLLTTDGRSHPMYQGKKSCFDTFVSHNDEATWLPDNVQVLSGNSHSRIQSVCATQNLTDFWAVQYHPEYTLDYISKMILSREERLLNLGFFKNKEDLVSFSLDLALADKTKDFDLLWKYGISQDVLDTDIRQIEVKNWLNSLR
jgi:GMP synthase (glutamine-hydrolysing)